PAQGRCRRRRPRLARSPNRRGPRDQRRYHRAGAAAVRRAGARRRPGPQAPGAAQPPADARRPGRGPTHRPGLLRPARGPPGVDEAVAGAQVRRMGGRPRDPRRDGAAVPQKNEIKPWLKEQWCIPPQADAEFVCRMEDVLEAYHRPYDEKRPLVGLDEVSKQLVGEVVQPIPAAPGQPERFDYEYVRNGAVNL